MTARGTPVTAPAHPVWDTLMRAFLTVVEEAGSDPYVGRRLPGLRRATGLRDVQVEAHARLSRPGEYQRTHQLSLLDSVRDAVVGRGLLSERELTELSDALHTYLEAPGTIVVRQRLFPV